MSDKEHSGDGRIDKWLWATRVYKTRSIAAEECKKNRVELRDQPAKPSAIVRVGDIIKVRKPPMTYTFRVKALLNSRVGAKLVDQYLENLTPESEYEILELNKLSGFVDRSRGLGRPTKKERRELDRFKGVGDLSDWWNED